MSSKAPEGEELRKSNELNVIHEKQKSGSKSVGNLHVVEEDNVRGRSMGRGNRSLHNQSFSATRSMNQSMSSKIDGSMMLERKQNVKSSQQNMTQLRHRIDALKRNVELAQKKEAQAERERQQLELAMHNKEQKNLARMALEEDRQRKVQE